MLSRLRKVKQHVQGSAYKKLPATEVSGSVVILSIVIMGLVVHGIQANGLGLYWDDGEQLMQAFQASDSNALKFIFSDTFAYLPSERPFAYVALIVQRAAFAFSLTALHWTLVGLLLLNAAVLASIALRMINDKWFGFAVGVIFLTYPLSPLQGIWAATAHYLWASLLALLSVLFALNGLRVNERRRFQWFALTAATYLASLITHEVFALIPPAFVGSYAILRDDRRIASRLPVSRMHLYRPAAECLVSLWATLAIYGLWRLIVLPTYGRPVHPARGLVLRPDILITKFLASIKALLTPWIPAVDQILAFPPSVWFVFLSAIISVAVWTIMLQLLRHPASRDDLGAGDELTNANGHCSVQAAVTGFAVLIAALALVVSPEIINTNFGASFASRANFGATIGIALVLPILLMFLLRLYNRALSVKNESESILPPGGRQFLSCTVACVVLLGSLFHASSKKEFTVEWNQHKRMLSQLQNIAPGVRDDTFVIIVHSHARGVLSPYSTHWELSSYLLALYDNWSLMGNTSQHISFYSDGIESKYYGTAATWFPPGVKGPMLTHANLPVSRIPYDRLLLFECTGNRLGLLPKMEVMTQNGEHLVVHNNPERILTRVPASTAIWRHIAH